jgi:hypothetical protein
LRSTGFSLCAFPFVQKPNENHKLKSVLLLVSAKAL